MTTTTTPTTHEVSERLDRLEEKAAELRALMERLVDLLDEQEADR